MTLTQVRDALSTGADSVSYRKGIFTARRGFFYTHGYTAEKFVANIRRQVPGAQVLTSGEVWKNFSGRAPLNKQSHWFATFTVKGA
jgi:hypothetical protein